ncbi:MAG: Arc family DNA-binding protein [Pseudomonas sp.]
MKQADEPNPAEAKAAVKFVVRLPAEMRERIATVSRENYRSMNSEILVRLEHSLRQPAAHDDHDKQSGHAD